MLLTFNYDGATLGISLVTNVRRISVKEVMKTDFGTIDGRATIKEALHEMKRLKSTVLVVNKRDENDEYGLILVSDIAEQVLARDRSPSRVNVYEIMTKPAISVDPNMDIRYCSRLMSALKLTRILVVKDNVLLGRVSPRALVLDGLAAIEADD
jgi:CBS domain-containing protein